MEAKHYRTLFMMLALSLVIMYSVMFLNVDEIAHVHLSLSRLYMSLLMVTPMGVLMLVMMKHMFPDKKLNMIVHASCAAVFVLALALLRTQTPVGDRQYMQAMIPHHSSAIMTSKHANITDPEVKQLSEKIIASQKEEIAQMKNILERTKTK